jgi:hypothetical protein
MSTMNLARILFGVMLQIVRERRFDFSTRLRRSRNDRVQDQQTKHAESLIPKPEWIVWFSRAFYDV